MSQGGSIFDILGPIMVGPSSSHTAGAVRLGRLARQLSDTRLTLVSARMVLYNSFAQTYKGHGTDRGLAAGLVGADVDSPTIPTILEELPKLGIHVEFEPYTEANSYSPNTVAFYLNLKDTDGKEVESHIVGHSIGGGKVYISQFNGYNVTLRGEAPTLIMFYKDQPGMIWRVTKIIAEANINIASLQCSRQQRGKEAFMNIVLDSPLPPQAVDEVYAMTDVYVARSLDALPE